MEFFAKAKMVRLRSHHDKFLLAEEDEESVTQDRNGSSSRARWTVEIVPGSRNIIRLKSCYGKYLTAWNQPLLIKMTARKVIQSLPEGLDSSVEWEPVRDGKRVKLKTQEGRFLRANGGFGRNSVTHDIPHRTLTQYWVFWDVDIVDIQVQSPDVSRPRLNPNPTPSSPDSHLDYLIFESSSPSYAPIKSGNFSRQESSDSYVGLPPKFEGRTIYYHVINENGEVDDGSCEGNVLIFKGDGVDELTQKLRDELGIQEIFVCTRSPLNEELYPLRLRLPPNNADMHVFVVPSS